MFGVNLVADIGSLAVRLATPDEEIVGVERCFVRLTSTADEGGVMIDFEDSGLYITADILEYN